MVDIKQRMIVRHQTETPFGTLLLELYVFDDYYISVRLDAPFMGEYIGVEDEDESDEYWEGLNEYNWEDPEEFPQTPEQFVEYLAFAAEEISRRFEWRVAHQTELLMAEAERHYKKHRAAPTLEWLGENYPKQSRLEVTPTSKFKRRVAAIVLESFAQRGMQLSLF